MDPAGIACPYARKKQEVIKYTGVSDLIDTLSDYDSSNALVVDLGRGFNMDILRLIDEVNEQSLTESIIFESNGNEFFGIFMGPYIEYLSGYEDLYPFPNFHPRQYEVPILVFLGIEHFQVKHSTQFKIAAYETMKILAMTYGPSVFDHVEVEWDFGWFDNDHVLSVKKNEFGVTDSELIACNRDYSILRKGIWGESFVREFYEK